MAIDDCNPRIRRLQTERSQAHWSAHLDKLVNPGFSDSLSQNECRDLRGRYAILVSGLCVHPGTHTHMNVCTVHVSYTSRKGTAMVWYGFPHTAGRPLVTEVPNPSVVRLHLLEPLSLLWTLP